MADLSGKRILITGAAGGIGSAVADALKSAGAIDLRTDVESGSGVMACDVTKQPAIEWLLDRLDAEGAIDGLVHCAARCGTSGPFPLVSEAEWNSVVDVTLGGTFRICQAVARRMMASGTPGRIVVIGSVNAIAAERNNSPYVAAKGGVRMLVKAMAVDLAQHGITVNLIHPGAIVVPRNKAVMEGTAFQGLMRHHTPVGRPGTVDDVARAAEFLLDSENHYITGAELAVDGGVLAQLLGPRASFDDVQMNIAEN